MAQVGEEYDSPLSVYIAEGEKLYKAADFKKAVESFTRAIQQDPENAMTHVQRAKCYLAMGDAQASLEDSDQSLKIKGNFHRGIYQKAEALYSLGDFEFALVNYHRGQKLRPELNEFRLGVQKAREAIVNSVGTPKSVNLKESLRASGAGEHGRTGHRGTMAGGKDGRMGQKRGTLAIDSYSERKQSRVTSARYQENETLLQKQKQKTAKQVLGEMYPDKAFLMKLLEDDELTKGTVANGMSINELILSGLNYLDTRTDFWQQHKPIYARKRDRMLMQQKWSKTEAQKGTSKAKTTELLKSLENAEALLESGKPSETLLCLKDIIKFNPLEKQSPDNASHIYGLLGAAQVEMGQFTEALGNHKRELKIAEQNNLTIEKSRALDNIGRVYARLGKFDSAIEAWTVKLPLAESALEKAWLHHELGRCHFELGRCEQAITHGKQSYDNASEASDSTWQINAKVLLAEALQKSDQKDAAKECFSEALDLAKFHADKAAEQAIEKALSELNL